MRNAFFRTLISLAESDDRIYLLVGDLGFGVVESFRDRFPDRFLNVGVAEQNMTGVAAGLALTGKIVFTYSIANFPTLRCLEQIRNDVCYHNLPVKIVAVGGGLAYGTLGATHHATEDIAIMRALPGMTVVAPGDPMETSLATRALVALGCPSYLRLGRAGEPVLCSKETQFEIGRAILYREGTDITLISTGGMLPIAVEAANLLFERGISMRVLSMHTVKPLDGEAIRMAAVETGGIVTLEEHSIVGGLGGAVSEILMEMRMHGIFFKRIGLPSVFTSKVGDRDFLLSEYSMSLEGVMQSVEKLVIEMRDGKKRRDDA